MHLTAEHQKQINHMFSAESQCADEMRSILEQEYETLLHKNSDDILSIIKNKQKVNSKMRKLMLHRERFLKALALPSGNPGIHELMKRLKCDETHNLWKKLIKQTHQLKEMNEVNGGIVNISLKNNRQALDILTGHSSENETYGPGGQSRKGGYHQTLAKV